MTISIPKPCHEKWESFVPTEKGGFCSNCRKDVIDFTTWSPTEIQAYFTKKPFGACGRFNAAQLRNYPSPSPLKMPSPFKWLIPSLVGVSLTLLPKETIAQRARYISEQNDTSDIKHRNVIPLRTFGAPEPREIKGKVVDEQSQTLPGISVMLKGTLEGTCTDADGEFNLTIRNPSPTDTLVFSFIGMFREEIYIADKSQIDIMMKPDKAQLQEVVVVGGMVCTYRPYSPRGLWIKIKRLFKRN